MSRQPCLPTEPCFTANDIQVNADVLAEMEAERRGVERRCEHPRCSVRFRPVHGGHRFCSTRCARSAARLRWLAEHPRLPGPTEEQRQAIRERGWARASETQKATRANAKTPCAPRDSGAACATMV